MTPKDIASALGVVRSRVTRIVEGLEKKGLLRRMPDPDDSRVALFSLTASGRERWESAREHVRGVNAAILGRLSDGQRGDMLSALAMLKVSMDAVSPLGADGGPSGRDDDFSRHDTSTAR